MSGDLISRKAVIESIENCHVIEDAYCLVDYINELPIAYNVDKIVEQLRKEISDCMCDECDRHTDCDTCRAEKAVEIVKSGGIE